MKLTSERLHELLNYDPDTGVFSWRVDRSYKSSVGNVAGTTNRRGYRVIVIDGKSHKAHRLAWLYVYGAWPQRVVDHINGCAGDNRITNLRDVLQAINNQNLKRARKDNRIGLLGVSADRGRFMARITVGGQTKHLGCYATAQQAHDAYVSAKKTTHTSGP